MLRHALKIPPRIIVDRLIKAPEVQAAADLCGGQLGSFGRVRYEDVREALGSAAMETDVSVEGNDNNDRVVLRRTPVGVLVRSATSDSGHVFLELSLFDPEPTIRSRALDTIAARSNPWLPSEDRWRRAAVEGPLQVHHFVEFIRDVGEVAEKKLEVIGLDTRKATLGVEDLVPRGRTYYESLVGPVPAAESAADYVEGVLYPHLSQILAKDAVWGWRCLRAACLGRSVAPERVAASLQDDHLHEVLSTVRPCATPFGPLAVLSVALPRAKRDHRFLALAEGALSDIFSRATMERRDLGPAAVFPQLAVLTMRRLGSDEETWNAPPYWRRLAGFVHAHALLDVLDFEGVDLLDFGRWCQSVNSPTALAAEFMDLRAEPMWRPGLEYASGMWQIAAGHAIRLCEAAAPEIDLSHIAAQRTFDADAGRRARAQFWAALPDPMEGGQRIAQNPDAPVLEQAASQRILADIPPGGPSLEAWQVLLAYARIVKFDEQFSQAIGEWLSQGNTVASDDAHQTIEVAALAASIASVQSNAELAEATARFILQRADSFRDHASAAGAWGSLVIAAAAHPELEQWSDWLTDKLLALAYGLPKGEACRDFAARIEAMHRLIPLAQRRWGHVRAAALCA